jgi:hypothetical protein
MFITGQHKVGRDMRTMRTRPLPNMFILGALIGGPDKTDTFKEDVNEYQYTEVAIDYNAGFVGALAEICQAFWRNCILLHVTH